jgi:CRP-like cAMP-binding protein
MVAFHDVLTRKLKQHSALETADIAAIQKLPVVERRLGAEDDIVRQGDKPTVSAVVIHGMLARYHTLPTGRRQYLSLHIAGDWPDAQALFIAMMDHSVGAIDDAMVGLIPHTALQKTFEERPAVASAVWRETLIDAAIFREAITNNSARPLPTRLAHFCCEQYYRARAAGIARPGTCRLPLTQTQLGELLGASLPSISRALQNLRKTRAMDLHGGEIHVHDWSRLATLGDFNPAYLHLVKPSRL